MIVTHKIKMDLAHKEIIPHIDVMQDDKYSRDIQLSLYVNRAKLSLPDDCDVLIRYQKKDGAGGMYDTMPDGSVAWEIQDNVVTVRLAPQVCTVPGAVHLNVTLFCGKVELNCFTICLNVQAIASGQMKNRPYVNVTGFLPQPYGAKIGQYLKVAAVDERGRVTGLETAEVEMVIPEPPAQPDWNAAEGEDGHVLNRTHWVETIVGDELVNGTYTTESLAEYGGAFGADIPFAASVSVVPEVIDVVFDGVEYNDLAVISTEAGYLAGNLLKINALSGTAYEDTGEPFFLGIGEYGCLLATVLTESTTHTLIIKIPDKEIVQKLDNKFIDAEWMATKKLVREAAVLEKTELSFYSDSTTGNDECTLFYALPLEPGKMYEVVIDGTAYQKTAIAAADTVAMGALAVVDGVLVETNDCPFTIVVFGDNSSAIGLNYAATDLVHTVEIYEIGENINKLPEEFLPEGYSKDELVAAVVAALPNAEEVSF